MSPFGLHMRLICSNNIFLDAVNCEPGNRASKFPLEKVVLELLNIDFYFRIDRLSDSAFKPSAFCFQ